MPVNPYFNKYEYTEEQDLHASLVQEAIQIHGMDIYYLPRRYGNKDELLEQDDMSYFDTAYMVDMYLKNVEQFEGQGEFLSKFGLEIRDRVTFEASTLTFKEIVTSAEEDIVRPREGDLIFIPIVKKLFQILEDDPRKAIFYPLGALPSHLINCEVFEYGNEVFTTGIDDIDYVMGDLSTDEVPFFETDGNGDVVYDADGNPVTVDEFIIPERDLMSKNELIDQRANTAGLNLQIVNPFKN